VIEEVLSMMDFENPGKQVRIIRQLEESPHRVSSDPDSLKQVLINILTNAMESLGEAGEIAVRSSFDPEVGIVTISISDSGPGIDEGILDRIFEPFYTTRETGTGLGLAISREIILSYGGDIGFRKNTPRGSICFITLPLINELNGKHGD
jgi:signal transduction histidine kinase